ncbi:MAG: hypothetical protein M1465_02125 [Candidatus Marsarchaeota archaeon]|nr:hypothetical protein [Candidatus Marsarchaeota archaeon]
MEMKALFTGLEQLIAFSMLFVAVLSVTAFILHYYRADSLNSSFFTKKAISYSVIQQISYEMATNNYSVIGTGEAKGVSLYDITDSGQAGDFCYLSYTESKNYSCGIVTYQGRVYLIKVDQNA